MKKCLFALAALSLLMACTPEENGPDNNQSGNGGDKIVHVTGISLDRNSATIKEGEYITLVATVTPANADNKSVSWSSSSDAVATVDASGKVTGVKAGSATITATAADGGMKATCSLSVEANLAPSVTVVAKNVSAISAVLAGKANLGSTVPSDLKVGFQYSKSAGILPSNSTTIEATDADAAYNYTAAITGLDPDTKYYFRSFVRQNGQDTYGETKEFTTKDVASLLETRDASGIEATKAALNAKLDLTDVLHKSLTYGFLWGTSESALNTDYECTEISDNAISATLTNLSHKTQYWYKAYVTLDGQTFYGEVKTFTTDVVHVERVSLNITEYAFHSIGSTLMLNATVFPSDATEQRVKWSSNRMDVATVDQSGNVKAVGYGNAVITVTSTDQEKTATCAITVNQWVTSITFDKLSIPLIVGESVSLDATVSPTNATDQSLVWSSSDESVAHVNSSTGVILATKRGTAIITATANDGSGVFASFNAIVRNPVPNGAVDLGLSVHWATCNLTADGFVESMGEYGSYYAWGSLTSPWKFFANGYIWYDGGGWGQYGANRYRLKKYVTDSYNTYYGEADNKVVLESDDDAAHVFLGANWRIPTNEEFLELLDNCTFTWTTIDDHCGAKFTSRVEGYTDSWVFFPAAGYKPCITSAYAISESDIGSVGHYWSASLGSNDLDAWGLTLNNTKAYMYSKSRPAGLSIRPISE